MTLYDYLIAPFIEFAFMRRALVATIAVSISAGIMGVFLVIRRMSLIGDALSHGILPGVALGFLYFGFNVVIMSFTGMLAGILIACCASLMSQHSVIKEDASFAALYLIALALGVIIISKVGTQADLMHILFGSVLAVDNTAMILVISSSIVTLLSIAIIYRPLLLFSLDPIFLRSISVKSQAFYIIFLVLVVMNLVAGFQALGSLMVVGLLMLPAIAAHFWSRNMELLFIWAVALGISASVIGLLLSFHFSYPSGPVIILIAGLFYIISMLLGSEGGVIGHLYQKKRHKVH